VCTTGAKLILETYGNGETEIVVILALRSITHYESNHLHPRFNRRTITKRFGLRSSGIGLPDTCRDDRSLRNAPVHGCRDSGSKGIEDRPALTEALAALKKGDVLIVAKRDRIARDMLVTLTVEKVVSKRGARLLSVAGEGSDSEGVTGLILRTMTDVFAQVERETIRTRTRSALQVKKSKAERVGAIPYGYRLAEDGIHLIESEREQRIIALVQSLRADKLSLRAIVARLNGESVTTRTGNVWQLTQVARILK